MLYLTVLGNVLYVTEQTQKLYIKTALTISLYATSRVLVNFSLARLVRFQYVAQKKVGKIKPDIFKVKNFISLLLVLGLTVYTPVGYVYRYNTECLLVNTRDTHYPCPVGSIPTSVTNYKTCDFIQYTK